MILLRNLFRFLNTNKREQMSSNNNQLRLKKHLVIQ